MTYEQRIEHRELYQQLRLAISFPGETIGGVTKRYAPIDKWSLSYDELLLLPDTPDIAARRGKRQTTFWFLLGKHGAAA